MQLLVSVWGCDAFTLEYFLRNVHTLPPKPSLPTVLQPYHGSEYLTPRAICCPGLAPSSSQVRKGESHLMNLWDDRLKFPTVVRLAVKWEDAAARRCPRLAVRTVRGQSEFASPRAITRGMQETEAYAWIYVQCYFSSFLKGFNGPLFKLRKEDLKCRNCHMCISSVKN